MIDSLFFLFIIISIFTLIKYSVAKKILLSDSGDKHQKFISKLKVPLIGGITLLFSILYIEIDYNIKRLLVTFNTIDKKINYVRQYRCVGSIYTK